MAIFLNAQHQSRTKYDYKGFLSSSLMASEEVEFSWFIKKKSTFSNEIFYSSAKEK